VVRPSRCPASTAIDATRSTASRSRHPDRPRSHVATDRSAGTARQPHAGTPAGTASGSSIPLAWRRILPARSDTADPALRCPRKRGHSTHRGGFNLEALRARCSTNLRPIPRRTQVAAARNRAKSSRIGERLIGVSSPDS
jgi:hypothetical protein